MIVGCLVRLTYVLALLGVMALGPGCGATLRPRAHFMELEPPSKEPPAHWVATSAVLRERFEARREGPLDEAANGVLLLIERYPKGTVRVRNQLHVQNDAGYELIGGYNLYAAGANTLWFGDYASAWRKAVCYPQVPLTWASLGLWQLIVPVSWPCLQPARFKLDFAWHQVRHLAAAAGADVAIVEMKMNDDEVVVAWGWLLRQAKVE